MPDSGYLIHEDDVPLLHAVVDRDGVGTVDAFPANRRQAGHSRWAGNLGLTVAPPQPGSTNTALHNAIINQRPILCNKGHLSESLAQAMGPLDRPRYVIRRFVDYRIDTWLSRILPKIIGQYFQREHHQMEMVHALPTALSRNKDLAALFGRHWNVHVSPGQPVYARSDEGEQLIELALLAGITSGAQIHKKEVFV